MKKKIWALCVVLAAVFAAVVDDLAVPVSDKVTSMYGNSACISTKEDAMNGIMRTDGELNAPEHESKDIAAELSAGQVTGPAQQQTDMDSVHEEGGENNTSPQPDAAESGTDQPTEERPTEGQLEADQTVDGQQSEEQAGGTAPGDEADKWIANNREKYPTASALFCRAHNNFKGSKKERRIFFKLKEMVARGEIPAGKGWDQKCGEYGSPPETSMDLTPHASSTVQLCAENQLVVTKMRAGDIELNQLRIGGTDMKRVEEFRELLIHRMKFDPIDVHRLPDGRIVAYDGNHRIGAYIAAYGPDVEIEVRVHKADEVEAWKQGTAINNRDKRALKKDDIINSLLHAVTTLGQTWLIGEDSDAVKMYNKYELANMFSIDHKTLNAYLKVVKELVDKGLTEYTPEKKTKGKTKDASASKKEEPSELTRERRVELICMAIMGYDDVSGLMQEVQDRLNAKAELLKLAERRADCAKRKCGKTTADANAEDTGKEDDDAMWANSNVEDAC